MSPRKRDSALPRRALSCLIAGAWLVLLAGEPGRADGPEAAGTTGKVLIEFGWDEPDTSFMRRHVDEMEQTPFDGCVFHALAGDPRGPRDNFAWLGWGVRAFTEAELQPALDDLKATPFRRFRHNFLRFNTAPGLIDWFDDHAAILNNARLAARVAREGGCAGILFDVEEYQGKLFTYAPAGRGHEVVGRICRPGRTCEAVRSCRPSRGASPT